MRCDWRFVRSDTPFGPILAHYPMVEDRPGAEFLRELLIPVQRAEGVASAFASYWLLQRLATISDALIVLTTDERVVYSGRCRIGAPSRAVLRETAQQASRTAASQVNAFAASKWHMEHFDAAGIRFEPIVTS